MAEEQDVKYTTVSIPSQLFDKIKDKIKGTGFASVSSYVTYILREIIANEVKDRTKMPEAFSKEDEEKVKSRLKALGYME